MEIGTSIIGRTQCIKVHESLRDLCHRADDPLETDQFVGQLRESLSTSVRFEANLSTSFSFHG